MEDMGAKIKRLRLEMGMTLEELGNKVGVGKSTVRKWENGMIENMKRDKIANVSKALNVSPAYLMGWEEVSPRAEIDSCCRTKDEENLIITYRVLTEFSKTRINRYVNDLANIEKAENLVNAAHERTDIEVTDEMRKHDDDIMDDDDF